MPRNMSLLSERLPKSNYGVKLRSSEDVVSTASSAFIKSEFLPKLSNVNASLQVIHEEQTQRAAAAAASK